ncbi:MAG: LuxR C-terminal-related transcriptional regulator [Bacteroidales bacterium]|nr:LuxR C-terminal-related transcriptional regulator [Bacteroidales bacterium]
MSESTKKILNDAHNSIKKFSRLRDNCSEFKDFPLLPRQAIYIVDFHKRKICLQKGILTMLGFTEDEFNFDYLSNMVHPDDVNRYNEILNFSFGFVFKKAIKPFELDFSLTYRIRKKDGSYLKIMRNSSILETDENGNMLTNLSLLTDISFLNKNDRVEWAMSTQNEDIKKLFREHIKEKHKNYFSVRELEILDKLKEGKSSNSIASMLLISKHTVDTHRRNMLSKSGCKNTIELLEFSKQHEIF